MLAGGGQRGVAEDKRKKNLEFIKKRRWALRLTCIILSAEFIVATLIGCVLIILCSYFIY
jgi:hypothetical protein